MGINIEGLTPLEQEETLKKLLLRKKILELQKEGKQPMKSDEFLKGNKLKIGTNLISDV